MTDSTVAKPTTDSDVHKGATEDDQPGNKAGSSSMDGQLDHRSDEPEIKDADTDFPEPGFSPEHSGQHS